MTPSFEYDLEVHSKLPHLCKKKIFNKCNAFYPVVMTYLGEYFYRAYSVVAITDNVLQCL